MTEAAIRRDFTQLRAELDAKEQALLQASSKGSAGERVALEAALSSSVQVASASIASLGAKPTSTPRFKEALRSTTRAGAELAVGEASDSLEIALAVVRSAKARFAESLAASAGAGARPAVGAAEPAEYALEREPAKRLQTLFDKGLLTHEIFESSQASLKSSSAMSELTPARRAEVRGRFQAAVNQVLERQRNTRKYNAVSSNALHTAHVDEFARLAQSADSPLSNRPKQTRRFSITGRKAKPVAPKSTRRFSVAAGSSASSMASKQTIEENAAGEQDIELEEVEITYYEQGPMGIIFEDGGPGCCTIKGLKVPERFPNLLPGMVLSQVQGVDVREFKYKGVVSILKTAGRPCTMVFHFPAGHGQGLRYEVVKRALIRKAFADNSEKLGYLDIGEVVEALEVRKTSAGQHRVHMAGNRRGWVSIVSSDDTTLLKETDQEMTDNPTAEVAKTYRCAKRSQVRIGFDLSSASTGYVEEGEILRPLESRLTKQGKLRLRIERAEVHSGDSSPTERSVLGWLSIESKNSSRLLVPYDEEAANKAAIAAIEEDGDTTGSTSEEDECKRNNHAFGGGSFVLRGT